MINLSAPDFFGTTEQLDALSGAGQACGDRALFRSLVTRAWYLRQRDTAQALACVAEAEALLADIQGGTANDDSRFDMQILRGRLLLTRADCHRLLAGIDESARLIAAATAAFALAGDAVGLGDTAFCEAERQLTLGRQERALAGLIQARDLYGSSGDRVRAAIVNAVQGRLEVWAGGAGVNDRWGPVLAAAESLSHPAVNAYAAAYQGSVSFGLGAFTDAIRHYEAALAFADVGGTRWLEIGILTAIGSSYENLNDFAVALEYQERAFQLAQSAGWPEAIASTQTALAGVATKMDDLERAGSLYSQALDQFSALPGNRRALIASVGYGDLCLAVGRPAEALVWFEQAAGSAREINLPNLAIDAMRGCILALTALGRINEALRLGDVALDLTRERRDAFHETLVLEAVAAAHALKGGDGIERAVECLEMLIALAGRIHSFIVPDSVFTALARHQEALGNLSEALAAERQARESHQRIQDRASQDRMLALQLRFDRDRDRAEAEYLRRMAEAERQRAGALDQALSTLQALGQVGLEITSSLNAEAVFLTLYRHLGALLSAPCLYIGLLDEKRQCIDLRFRIEDGERQQAELISLDNPNSYSVRCLRSGDEILIHAQELSEREASKNLLPGSRMMKTMLFRPLRAGNRLLGVLSIQSDLSKAYGPRELDIFRTLCAYGAIALANAEAYQELDSAMATLRDTQDQLVQQAKLASLGQLVAGLAHEVNTPVGIMMTAASHLSEMTRSLRERIDTGQLRRSQLIEFMEQAEESGRLMVGTSRRAADLVTAFKQVAADQVMADLREIDLLDYLQDIVAMVDSLMKPRGILARTEFPDGQTIRMTVSPGLLSQIVTNLLQNTVVHAFDGIANPVVTVTGRRTESGRIQIQVADNGRGMDPETCTKVFEPFFTTRRGKGGTGLGLHIVHNMVTGPMRGEIRVESTPGQGTCFIVDLPVA
jgi:signal transduction histidine kinase